MKSDDFCNEYRLQQNSYREFSGCIAGVIQRALEEGGIKAYSISHREKDIDKLCEKIQRKEANGTPYSVLQDVEDLAGVRVVTYLESQKEEAINLIYKTFESARPRVENKYNPEGYRGTHFILTLDEERKKLTEYSHFNGLKCEVQVSSILYHAWSEIEHDVIYKPGYDREKLKDLGLDEIESAFKKIMAEHLEEATIQFDLLNKKHKEVLLAGKVIYSDYLSEIRDAPSNEHIASILSIADKFSHKKPEEVVQMIEEVIKLPPLAPQVLHRFEDRELLGKSNEKLLLQSIEILKHFHVRYWDTERVLVSLFILTAHISADVSTKALEAIKEVVKYNHSFVNRYKNLYPQVAALGYIQKISPTERDKFANAISLVGGEILSSEIEGTEWSSSDTLTHHSGSMVPNDVLKKLRKDTIDFLVQVYESLSNTKEKILITKALLRTIVPPFNVAYGDDLVEMIQDDSKKLAVILTSLLYQSTTASDYLIAQEVDEALIHLLRRDSFKNPELMALYERLQKDTRYAQFSTLVGNIQEFRDLDEDWQVAETRRIKEIGELVNLVSESSLDEWYKTLNDFARPVQEGLVDEWKYNSYRTFITQLTVAKPTVATALLTRAVNEKTSLASDIFITPYLSALRHANDFESWDSMVNLIKTLKVGSLARSVAVSLNLQEGSDLDSQIRETDTEILTQLVRHDRPFEFVDEDDYGLRYFLVNTLTRLFAKEPGFFEKLLVEEIQRHKEKLNMYFRELPFASHRKWMTFTGWSSEGIDFIKSCLVELSDIDWHVQEMMLQLGTDPIELILEIFKQRSKNNKGVFGPRYEEIPYHFNPELQKYLAEHPKYSEEMVKWLQEMTPEWSTYNWHVTHFIQRIGGPSFASILMKLIESGEEENLKRATDALRAFDNVDLSLCMEIVKRTDNQDILSEINGAMISTGVVSGENGLGLAYEAKATQLDQYAISDDKRIREFAIATQKSFRQMAITETQRSAERKRVRKIEFESS